MSKQDDFRLPKTGDVWRHYKGVPYRIVGLARDDKGDVIVVYTEFVWGLAGTLPPLYTQTLQRFLQEVENTIPRFVYHRGWIDKERYAFVDADAHFSI